MRYFITYRVSGDSNYEDRDEIDVDDKITCLDDIRRIENRLADLIRLDDGCRLEIIRFQRFDKNYDTEQISALLFVAAVVVCFVLWAIISAI